VSKKKRDYQMGPVRHQVQQVGTGHCLRPNEHQVEPGGHRVEHVTVK